MKRIGFIDYYLDEWHANNYPAWIREQCRAAGIDFDIALAWADMDRPGGLSTDQWCSRSQVAPASSLEEVVERSDCLIILSPDNPEQHERLARLPLMSGKPVYIDKTFAPDLAAGRRMFELAAQYGTPLFSSSALRFSRELLTLPQAKPDRSGLEYLSTLGPGSFANYAVHQLEMIVALAGPEVQRVKSLSGSQARSLIIDYAGGCRASMLQIAEAPFRLSLQYQSGESRLIDQCTDFFPNLIAAILNFFATGLAPVPSRETLAIMALIEAGRAALASDDTWVDIPGLA